MNSLKLLIVRTHDDICLFYYRHWHVFNHLIFIKVSAKMSPSNFGDMVLHKPKLLDLREPTDAPRGSIWRQYSSSLATSMYQQMG